MQTTGRIYDMYSADEYWMWLIFLCDEGHISGLVKPCGQAGRLPKCD